MKITATGIVLILVIAAFAAYVLFYPHPTPSVNPQPDGSKIKELETSIAQKDEKIKVLKEERDSLLHVKDSVRIKYVHDAAKIDSSIKKDSANAVPEYRKALELFGYKPAHVVGLTYWEIGIGAKLMTENYGMRLQIHTYKNIIQKDSSIISKYVEKEKDFNGLLAQKDNDLEYWKGEFENTQRYWYERFVISIGPGIGYTGTNFYPVLTVNFGYKIWGMKTR